MRALATLLMCGALCAQTFEVASIKLAGPNSQRGSHGGPGTSEPARFRFSSATLLDLIAVAHNVEYFQVAGKIPLNRDRYDLIANVPEGATKEQFRVMMQTLSGEFPAYELVVARSGLKIGKQPPVEGFPDLSAGKPGMIANNSIRDRQWVVRLRAQQMPMRFLRLPTEPPIRPNRPHGQIRLHAGVRPKAVSGGSPESASPLLRRDRRRLLRTRPHRELTCASPCCSCSPRQRHPLRRLSPAAS